MNQKRFGDVPCSSGTVLTKPKLSMILDILEGGLGDVNGLESIISLHHYYRLGGLGKLDLREQHDAIRNILMETTNSSPELRGIELHNSHLFFPSILRRHTILKLLRGGRPEAAAWKVGDIMISFSL